MMEIVRDLPVVQLLLLVAATAIVRLLFLQPAEPPTAAGAAIMAIGIFAAGPLQMLPVPAVPMSQLLALELLVLWVYIASAYVASYFRGTFRRHVENTTGCFAIGTWVAGTAVLCRLINSALPEWRLLVAVLAVVAVDLWLGYVWLISIRFREIIAGAARLEVTGRILLSTVSTQAIMVLLESLFPGRVPGWLSLGLIGLGCFFYLLSLVLVLQRYSRQRGWRVADDWDNTNCILHGAMSITGLASVQSGVVPYGVIVLMWLWAGLMFVAVEIVEIARVWARVSFYGWRRGVLTYNVSQWARVFTFGMLYTFTLQMHSTWNSTTEAAMPWLSAVQGFTVAWGQYVVLLLLVIETLLFLGRSLDLRPVSLKSRRLGHT